MQTASTPKLDSGTALAEAALAALACSRDPRDACEQVLVALCRTLDCAAGGIWSVDQGGSELESRVFQGDPSALAALRCIPLTGVLRDAFMHGEVAVVTSADGNDPWSLACADAGFATQVVVPLPSDAALRSVLVLHAQRELELDSATRAVLANVATLLARSFDQRDRAQAMTEHVSERDTFVSSVGVFSSELGQLSDALRNNAGEQSSTSKQLGLAVEEVSEILESLRARSGDTLNDADSVIQRADLAAATSERGRASVSQVIESMSEIFEQVVAIAERLRELDQQTSQIATIIASVNEIAAQSKLLALNAAIEAARAGEHGRGFAVVAGEIRNLADQSRAATAQVREVLGEIVAGAASAVSAAEGGKQRTELGLRMAKASQERLEELAESMSTTSSSALRIAKTASSQAEGIEQVASSLVSIATATYATTMRAREAGRATEHLTALARQMMSLVSREGDESALAKGA